MFLIIPNKYKKQVEKKLKSLGIKEFIIDLPKNKNEKGDINIGYIYILKSKNLFKIGITKNINSRLCSYKTQNPFMRLIKIEMVRDYKHLEKKLHNDFADKRMKGEWFKLNNEDLSLIFKKIEHERFPNRN